MPARPIARVIRAASSSSVLVGTPKSSMRIRSRAKGPISTPKAKHRIGAGRDSRCSRVEKSEKMIRKPAISASTMLMSIVMRLPPGQRCRRSVVVEAVVLSGHLESVSGLLGPAFEVGFGRLAGKVVTAGTLTVVEVLTL